MKPEPDDPAPAFPKKPAGSFKAKLRREKMVVGVLQVEVRFHDCRSLKQKRGCIKQLITRVKNQFEVSVAEVGSQDKWQKAEVAVAVVGNDMSHVNQKLDYIVNFIESLGTADLTDHSIELISF